MDNHGLIPDVANFYFRCLLQKRSQANPIGIASTLHVVKELGCETPPSVDIKDAWKFA
jgi:hypothetical protein